MVCSTPDSPYLFLFIFHPNPTPHTRKIPTPPLQFPLPVPASLPLLSEGGIYLVDNGRSFVLWVGRTAPQQWLQDVSWMGEGRWAKGRNASLPLSQY